MDNIFKKTFLIFIALIILIPNAYSLEVCKMSDDYKTWLELSEEDKKNTIKPAYCQELYKKNNDLLPSIKKSRYSSFSINTRMSDILKASASQSRYNAVDDGIITTPKNQLATNSCWAFTGVSLIETAAIKEGLNIFDFSERHIEYAITRDAYTNGIKSNGFNRVLDSGGNSHFTASYFFRHEGPILENLMPYQNYNEKIDITTLPDSKAILDVGNYNIEYYSEASGCAINQISSIKEKIVQYGSVGASIYYNDAYLKNGKYYHNYDESLPNHAVTIVGWDDSISLSNFKGTPTINGAWIVKNSWGSDWANNGYFYISYSDMRICNNISTFSEVKSNSYDNAYAASETLSNYSFYNSNGDFYSSAKFTKNSAEIEYLDKISVEFNAGNVYEVYLSLDNNLNDSSTWINIASGYASEIGVKSFNFSPIAITSDYTIIIKFVSGYFPMMCKTNISSDLHYYMDINSGSNFYSFDGTTWNDTKGVTGTNYNGCEPVIYAYTKNASSVDPSFKINSITSSNEHVYIYSEDYFTVNISSANIENYDLFSIKILDSNNEVVNNYFDITKSIAEGKVILKPNKNVKAGDYTFELSYDNKKVTESFIIYSLITSSTYKIDEEHIYVDLKQEKELTKDIFLNNINTYGNTYNLLSNSGTDVTASIVYIGTGSQVKIGNKTFTIILKGDISGDGKIKSNDPLLISRYLVSLTELNNNQKLAADISSDNLIKSNDPLLISRFLVGLRESL